jgi:osmotically-inducible protein OsmY
MTTDRKTSLKPREDAGRATAENGVVILDGPDGVAVTMTPDAATRTAESLQAAATAARESQIGSQNQFVGDESSRPGDEG